MSAFTPAELAYLQSQRLGRIATAAKGQPHVVPVTFRYNPVEDAIGEVTQQNAWSVG